MSVERRASVIWKLINLQGRHQEIKKKSILLYLLKTCLRERTITRSPCALRTLVVSYLHEINQINEVPFIHSVSFSTWCFPNSLSAAWSWQFPLSAEKEGYCSVLGQVIGISRNNTGLNSEDPIWILALILTCYMTLRKSLNLHFLSSTKWMNLFLLIFS